MVLILVSLLGSVAYSEGTTDLDLADFVLYMEYVGETEEYKEKIGQRILDFGEVDATDLTPNEVLLYLEYSKLYLRLHIVLCCELVASSNDITNSDGYNDLEKYIDMIDLLEERYVNGRADSSDIQTWLRDMMNDTIENDITE